ncbi:MAG: MBL fold metallo-hydrolase [Gammaproteobacteria bacterium]|nr:MBL fold metallo-hydrolase [Gammaproteobacteria bacterium]
MRFACLGSGSAGNAVLVEQGATRLLVDCGFSLRETGERLARIGLEIDALDGILLTHEHRDHLAGIGAVARRFGLPVWASRGTFAAAQQAGVGELPDRRVLRHEETVQIGELAVTPIPVPHDAREPCQFRFEDGTHRAALLTDIGSITPHVRAQLDGCDALLVECNHDRRMLQEGPYSAALKARVGGPWGHLDNTATARLLREIDTSKLQFFVALHLSETNNDPGIVAELLDEVLDGSSAWSRIADQQNGFEWCETNT